MYAMIKTRPDIAFAVSTVSQFASNPNEEQWKSLEASISLLARQFEA
jgi:hypothetical protein